MTHIDRDMQVGEALFILGNQDLSDVDTLIREPYRKLEALRIYINELEDTGKFVDKHKIMSILEGEG